MDIRDLLRLSIRTRLVIAMVGTAAVAAFLVSALAFVTARSSLTGAEFDKLTTIREQKASQIESHMATVTHQVENLAGSPSTIDAMRSFRQDFSGVAPSEATAAEKMKRYYSSVMIARLPEGEAGTADSYLPSSPEGRRLQQLYLADNPNPVGSKHILDAADDGSAYSETHAAYHPVFRDFLERFGYYDIFLVEPERGNIVYSVFKEADYATSLANHSYSNTNFAEVFQAASLQQSGQSPLVDFAPYEASYGAPAAFIASPIFDGDTRIGVLVFQLPLDKINGVMTNNGAWKESGLGLTGESYIVGPDQKSRTESRFFEETAEDFYAALNGTELAALVPTIQRLDTVVGLLPIETAGARAALHGETGTDSFADYRGEMVMSSYRPLNIPGMNWVIMSEVDTAEALGPVRSFRNQAAVGTMVVILTAMLVAFIIGSAIAKPIVAASARIRSLASGERARDAMDETVGGELGQLAGAYNDLVTGMAELADRAGRVARGENPEPQAEDAPLNIANNGVLADAFESLVGTQDRLANQAALIKRGDLNNPPSTSASRACSAPRSPRWPTTSASWPVRLAPSPRATSSTHHSRRSSKASLVPASPGWSTRCAASWSRSSPTPLSSTPLPHSSTRLRSPSSSAPMSRPAPSKRPAVS